MVLENCTDPFDDSVKSPSDAFIGPALRTPGPLSVTISCTRPLVRLPAAVMSIANELAVAAPVDGLSVSQSLLLSFGETAVFSVTLLLPATART
ncbi:hypothetical protein R69608_07952 [Paraburkholderia nemoris]|nr:hypothetical protein R69608_07952 [Paraburkholderia nemoris]